MTLRFESVTAVLRVADVARSIAWYRDHLGFIPDPFPPEPPYEFCILRRDGAELMLRRTSNPVARTSRSYDWDVYLRVSGQQLIAVLDHARRTTPLMRGPERMIYGMVEFELEDPDGHRVCVGEDLADTTGIPDAVD